MVSFRTQRDKPVSLTALFQFYRKLVRVSHGHRADLPEEARPQDCKQLVSSPVEHSFFYLTVSVILLTLFTVDLEQKREKEPDINCLTSSGLPAPLGTINRKPKQETFGLIPDDGFVSINIS